MAKTCFWHLESYILQWKNTLPACVLEGRIFWPLFIKTLSSFLTKSDLPVSVPSTGDLDYVYITYCITAIYFWKTMLKKALVSIL